MLSIQERAVLHALQSNFPLSSRPFRTIAQKVGFKEEQVISMIRSLQERGIIRRIGAVLGHRVLGYAANALILWAVPDEQVQEVGRKMATFPEITHCYHRQVPPDWPYNLFAMVHAQTKDACIDKIEYIAKELGLGDYQVLFSTVEYKKSGLTLKL